MSLIIAPFYTQDIGTTRGNLRFLPAATKRKTASNSQP
jgi:hypothetical protein